MILELAGFLAQWAFPSPKKPDSYCLMDLIFFWEYLLWFWKYSMPLAIAAYSQISTMISPSLLVLLYYYYFSIYFDDDYILIIYAGLTYCIYYRTTGRHWYKCFAYLAAESLRLAAIDIEERVFKMPLFLSYCYWLKALLFQFISQYIVNF